MKIHRVTELPVAPVAGDLYLVKTKTGIEIYARNTAGTGYVQLTRKVKLNGPTSLYYTEVGSYTIQNYSDLNTYTISSSDGTVTRSGSTITFVCTDTTKTTASFVVNGRTFAITMKAIVVVAPTISSPTDGATAVAVSGTTVTASAFALNYSGATDTQLSADWEVSTDANFTTIVASSYNDTTNLTSWTIP